MAVTPEAQPLLPMGESRRKSEEFLFPLASAPSREAKFTAAIFSLSSTIIGGGALSVPYAFLCLGTLGGPLAIIVIALVSDFSAGLLVSCARRSGGSTYEEVAVRAFGRPAKIVTIVLVVLLTFLVNVAYLILLHDLITPVLQNYVLHVAVLGPHVRTYTILAVGVAVWPVCCLKNLNALRYTSFIGLVTMMILIVFMTIRCIGFNVAHPSAIHENMILAPPSVQRGMYGFPILAVAFLCHFNILPIHSELVDPTRKRMFNVIHITMTVCSILYIGIGMVGYLTFFGEIDGDILSNYADNDVLMTVGRCIFLVTVMMAYPVICQPCRNAIWRLVDMLHECCHTGAPEGEEESWVDNGAKILAASYSEKSPALSSRTINAVQEETDDPDGPPTAEDHIKHEDVPMEGASFMAYSVLATTLIVAAQVLVAINVAEVVVVWNFVGSSIGIIVAYILPALFYIKIRRAKKFNLRKACSYALLVFGTAAAVVCTYFSIAGDAASAKK